MYLNIINIYIDYKYLRLLTGRFFVGPYFLSLERSCICKIYLCNGYLVMQSYTLWHILLELSVSVTHHRRGMLSNTTASC